MPLFEFKCRRCGRQFESLVTGTRRAECPACGSEELDKQYSSFGTRSSSPGQPKSMASAPVG
jgi:putative FmdB family regulatory protein